MPFVAFTCECKTLFGRYRKRDEQLEATCPKCGATVMDAISLSGFSLKQSHLRLPNDQYDYISPIDGKHISSKRVHRDHLKRHNVIELGNEKPELKPFEAQIPRESIREEIKNNVERMKSDGTWRER